MIPIYLQNTYEKRAITDCHIYYYLFIYKGRYTLHTKLRTFFIEKVGEKIVAHIKNC